MIRVKTDWPVAVDSLDHTRPHGTRQDNSTNPAFCRAAPELFGGRPIRVLDLGCSGGRMVHDFLRLGHTAVGLEGSDYSLKHGRAEWPHLAGRFLFTCDCSRPFLVEQSTDGTCWTPMRFDLITAWEFMEHIPAERMATLLANIRSHLAGGGVFLASIPTDEDGKPNCEPWHVCWQPRTWWEELFRDHGFVKHPAGLELVRSHHVRGCPDTVHALGL